MTPCINLWCFYNIMPIIGTIVVNHLISCINWWCFYNIMPIIGTIVVNYLIYLVQLNVLFWRT